jgi:undecaprenyl-diphosphatase
MIYNEIISFKLKLTVIFGIITVPTLILGFVLHKIGYVSFSKNVLYIMVVNLIVGGVLMLIFRNKEGEVGDILEISRKSALKIGLIQSLSLVPGVSRSASVVFGGIFSNLKKSVAIELSFLSGVPIIFCATVLEVYSGYKNDTNVQSWWVLCVSMLISFVFALLGIKMMKFLAKYGKDFEIFGVYRIIIGVVLLFII